MRVYAALVSGSPVVRIPLQVGIVSVQSLAGGGLMAVGGLYGLLGAVPIASVLGGDDAGAMAVMYPVGVVATILMLMGLRRLARAFALRPSDIVLRSDGIVFSGGRHSGFTLGWDEVHAERWKVSKGRGTWSLLDGPDVDEAFVIAETSSLDECGSFRETVAAMVAMTNARGEAPRARAARPGILECAGCGAPLTPTDADAVTCDHCGARTRVSVDVQRRLAELAERRQHDRDMDRAVTLLLHQPTASIAGAIIAVAGSVALVTGLTWGVHLWRAFFAESLDASGVATSAMLVVAIELGMASIALAIVAARRSLHVVTLAIGAIAPAGPHGVWACRRCGGPLEAPAAVAIVACAYCAAANVVGVNVAAESPEDADARIARALATRAERHRRALLLAAVGFALLVLSTLAVLRGS